MMIQFAPLALAIGFFTVNVDAEPDPGDIACRYESTTKPEVKYYTCTELALKYSITVEKFFMLNPSVDKDCDTIKLNTVYCVNGCK
jgi:hypothetical protein